MLHPNCKHMKNSTIQFLCESGIQPDYLLTQVTMQEILDSPESDYNKQEAEKTLFGYSLYNAKFFKLQEADRTTFFVLYKIQGFQIFDRLSLFSSCISDSGFRQVNIIQENGKAFIKFHSVRFSNCQKNRKLFAELEWTMTTL